MTGVAFFLFFCFSLKDEVLDLTELTRETTLQHFIACHSVSTMTTEHAHTLYYYLESTNDAFLFCFDALE